MAQHCDVHVWLAAYTLYFFKPSASVLSTLLRQLFGAVRARMRWPVLIAALLVLAVAWVITSQILLIGGWRKAIWMSVEATATDLRAPPPYLRVSYDNPTVAPMPLFWDDQGAVNLIGVQPLSNTQPLQILSILGATSTYSLAQVTLPSSGWQLQPEPPAIIVGAPGMMGLVGASPAVTMTLAAGPGTGSVAFDWYDQHTEINLEAQPAGVYTVQLGPPARYRGWVLLPPAHIAQLQFALPRGEPAYTVQRITIFDDTPQTWATGTQLAGERSLPACNADAPAVCRVALPDLRAINGVPRRVQLGIWLGVALLGLLALGLFLAGVRLIRRLDTRYEIVPSGLGTWLQQRTGGWSRGSVTMVVGVIVVSYQLLYALFVPSWYTGDSTDYYANGWNLLQARSFSGMYTFRPPSYPGFLALTMWLFGHQTQGIVLLQHLSLALIGVVAAWLLCRRTNPLFAMLVGVLAGCSPAVSVTANVVWSEATFTATACVGFLLALYGRRPLPLLVAGLAIGGAAMVRSNGALLLMFALLWVAMRWWNQRGAAQALPHAASMSAALLLGYALVTVPWYLHFHAREGHWGVSSLGGWLPSPRPAPAELQHLTNAVEIAAWFNQVDQGSFDDGMAINRPYQMMFRPYAHANRPPSLPPVLTVAWTHLYDNRFPAETFRAYMRERTQSYVQNAYEAFHFNVFSSRPEERAYYLYGQVRSAVDASTRFETAQTVAPALTPDDLSLLLAKPHLGDEEARVLLGQLSYRWIAQESPVRTFMITSSAYTLNKWGWLTISSLVSMLFGLLLANHRELLVLSLYCWVSLFVPALIAIGIDRYVIVLEPLLYIAICLMLFALCCLRFRRRVVSEPVKPVIREARPRPKSRNRRR